MSSNNSGVSSIGFFGLLTLLFIALKLTGYIDWSWIWVLCPIWVPLTPFILVIAISGIVLLFSLIEEKFNK